MKAIFYPYLGFGLGGMVALLTMAWSTLSIRSCLDSSAVLTTGCPGTSTYYWWIIMGGMSVAFVSAAVIVYSRLKGAPGEKRLTPEA